MTSLTFASLFLLTILASTASGQGGIASCCRSISKTQVHRDLLKGYYVQDKAACPLHVVVFTTLKGKRICSNPNKLWTRTSMAFLDGKNWQLQRCLHH